MMVAVPFNLLLLRSPPDSGGKSPIQRLDRMTRRPGWRNEAAIADIAGRSWDRDREQDPLAMLRQSVAALAFDDRTSALRDVGVPTLVLHGR
jgi:hypothetical protein